MLATTVTIQAKGIPDISSALAITYNKRNHTLHVMIKRIAFFVVEMCIEEISVWIEKQSATIVIK